jgi:hypothetical protein
MAATHTLGTSLGGASSGLSTTKQYSGTGEVNIVAETVADSVTDQLIVISIDVSQIKSIYILSTQDLTLETNNSGAPVDTISLVANMPYIWTTDSYDTNKLGTDVTAIYLTNSSGATATFDLRCVYDSTP